MAVLIQVDSKPAKQDLRIVRASPFVKWAGGKAQLLGQLSRFFPPRFETYHEPFLGGGAVFFHVNPQRAILNDLNAELVTTYQVVQNNVELLIDELRKHDPHKHERSYFEKIRDEDPSLLDPVRRAARMIFLNRTCFNGLYRVNSKGKFNVPFGKNRNPLVLDAANLRECSKALKGKLLTSGPFETALAYAKRGDFVYLDPPYHPISKTANFTSYTKDDFGPAEQRTLAAYVRELDRRGCLFLLSNSDTELVRDLYSDLDIVQVDASRLISSKKETRGKIKESLVMNYKPRGQSRLE